MVKKIQTGDTSLTTLAVQAMVAHSAAALEPTRTADTANEVPAPPPQPEAAPAPSPAPEPDPMPRVSTLIVPTVGRRLHFYPNAEHQAELGVFDPSQPCDAGVLYVHNARRVNLLVTGPSGTQLALQNVQLAQADDVVADGDSYAAWMLYQYAQAAKHGA